MIEALLFDNQYKKQYSTAFFCIRCGNVWARLARVDSQRAWFAVNRTCEACPPGLFFQEVPGTLADPYEVYRDGHGVADLPQDLLEREFRLLVAVDNSTERPYNGHTMPNQRPPNMELTARIAELRSKILSNTVTKEELREACAALRADRTSAAERRAVVKAKEAPVDGAALLAKLAAFSK